MEEVDFSSGRAALEQLPLDSLPADSPLRRRSRRPVSPLRCSVRPILSGATNALRLEEDDGIVRHRRSGVGYDLAQQSGGFP